MPALADVMEFLRSGPDHAMSAVADFVGMAAADVTWVLVLVVGTVFARWVCLRAIAKLTHRLADPVGASRLGQLAVRALRPRRPRRAAGSSGLPVRASLAVLLERRRERARAIGSLLRSVTSAGLVVAALVVAASHFGMPGGILLGAGLVAAVGAAVAQGITKDIVAGAFLLFEDAYGVGDYVDVTFGAAGVVEQIGLRTTRLRGADGTVWHVQHSQMLRIGNRTQEQTLLLLDVTVGFPAVQVRAAAAAADPTLQPRVLGAADLAQAERLVRRALDRLDRDLVAARAAAATGSTSLPSTVAAIVPDLVPHASEPDLAHLRAATLEDTAPMDHLAEHLGQLLEDVTVPVLTDTAVVGLADANESSLTLRVTARVADTSRQAALALLRRRLFLDITRNGLTVAFAAVDPADTTL